MSSKENLVKTYQKKTDKEHVLDNPDTYTGSMEFTDYDTYVYDDKEDKINFKEINIIPGLYKLFDEGIVNCRDHHIRMLQAMDNCKPNIMPLTYIDISISDDGTITMLNDGNGIDIEKHPEYNIWIPEMIFGHLRTSTNYDKNEKKIVGGKNGFGFKLVLIWSEYGEIETVDHIRGLKYHQIFKNNLNIIEKPSITKCKKKPYTKVIFKPDYKRLGIDKLSPDMINLFKRRVYDIAAVTDKKVKVKYNGELIPITNFQQYVDLYIGSKDDTKRIYEASNERWEYAVCIAPKEEFTQVSFVNGIYTGKGGKHVDYLLNQIVKKLTTYIKKKKKIDVKSSTIKEQIMLFLRCDIENPAFDSQTKDYMNTPSSKFGTSCDVSEKFIEKIAKMGIMDKACALTEVKESSELKKTDGSKTKSIRGIPKLIDANYAGTNKSDKCTIIFCEGDSAKAGIVSGLSKEDRNVLGVYPMKGKLFNVRGESPKRILENKEVTEIKQILGIESGKEYTQEIVNTKLRYGKILFMTDQDLDGSHIKGLGINLFDSEWKSLINIPGFIGFMNTPILKAKKGASELKFYNDGEWNSWCSSNNIKGWKIKYYKGLGTSTSKEFKEYFQHKKIVNFVNNDAECNNAIDMVFNKTRANDRKTWLENYDRELYLDTNNTEVTYKNFINREMIHFSKYDCDRSIPNLLDGLKTSQRKILYTAFKRNLTTEIKVAQFSGSVSEISCYHHGENSLNGAIVGMAQDFVGSNNINLLEPKGQFGTRLQGGSDSASERYIHTNLNKLTRNIFTDKDDGILEYIDDDGTLVEPRYYVPIIPMILVNGSKGIGTGFSTDIMCYNPLTIIDYLENSLNDNIEKPDITPYYKNFKGSIIKLTESKWLFKGCYERTGKKEIRVTELPIGLWTDDYKKYIEELIDGNKTTTKGKKKTVIVKDYNDMSTDIVVDVTIIFSSENKLDELINKKIDDNSNELEKLLRLYTTKTTTNMHLFDENEKLKKFKTPMEIIDHYIDIRLNTYVKRKKYLIKLLEHETKILINKVKFIKELLNNTLDLRNKKKIDICEMLKNKDYDIIDDDGEFKYLIRLPMDSVSEENIEILEKNKDIKVKELNKLIKTKEKDIWLSELTTLKTEMIKFLQNKPKTKGGKNTKVKKKLKIKD
jgi:DNA topoisomerase II|tara:strand:- start:1558 stop:5016 length:3459 start_codon:yes stop_codon:yes gene_type:complete